MKACPSCTVIGSDQPDVADQCRAYPLANHIEVADFRHCFWELTLPSFLLLAPLEEARRKCVASLAALRGITKSVWGWSWKSRVKRRAADVLEPLEQLTQKPALPLGPIRTLKFPLLLSQFDLVFLLLATKSILNDTASLKPRSDPWPAHNPHVTLLSASLGHHLETHIFISSLVASLCLSQSVAFLGQRVFWPQGQGPGSSC